LTDLKEYALMYAKMGLAVFPLKPKDKRPANANGCKGATTDPWQIETWWSISPDSNIGIATGSVSGGLLVIDLDIDEEKDIDGRESLREWQQEHGELPDTWTSITGRGGYHLLYRDSAVNQNRVGLYEGIDIRGEGGYIVAPPSIHPNGRSYEWEVGPGDGEITQVNSAVINFLMGPVPEEWERQQFKTPEQIPDGERNSTLYKLACSMRARGDAEEAIRAAVEATNNSRCIPPLGKREINTLLKSAMKYESGTAPYKTVYDNGTFRQVKSQNLDMVDMNSVEEENPEWLIQGHLPKYQISTMVGDGGSGKTTVWCALVAAISSGKRPFLLGAPGGLDLTEYEPQRVLFFSAEDSYKYTLRRRLRKNGANLGNIKTIDIADERFQNIKFDSLFLEQLIAKYKPALVVFDPVQAFVPPNIRMGDRNAMRSCLAPLIGHGEKYGCTFLIIVHTNKLAGAWGRNRMADSADMWDISRSVELIGETNEPGIRYISQEKSNYDMIKPTVLFSIADEVVVYKGMADKKDRDFVTEKNYNTKQAPQREEAKEFILDFLKDGEKEVSELDEMAQVVGISKATLKRGKADLKNEGRIKYRNSGQGKEKKFYISLIATEQVN